jgi:hypothetical protein
MAVSESLEYSGGSCPYPVSVEPDIWADLTRISKAGSLQGLMGMDFVLDGQQSYFMEINPRMTTSCVGLSKVLEPGLGETIIHQHSSAMRHDGYAQWAILPLQTTVQARDGLLEKVAGLPTVASPPFPVGPYYMKAASKVLICVKGSDSLDLPGKVEETRRQLSGMHLVC